MFSCSPIFVISRDNIDQSAKWGTPVESAVGGVTASRPLPIDLTAANAATSGRAEATRWPQVSRGGEARCVAAPLALHPSLSPPTRGPGPPGASATRAGWRGTGGVGERSGVGALYVRAGCWACFFVAAEVWLVVRHAKGKKGTERTTGPRRRDRRGFVRGALFHGGSLHLLTRGAGGAEMDGCRYASPSTS